MSDLERLIGFVVVAAILREHARWARIGVRRGGYRFCLRIAALKQCEALDT